MSSYEQSFLDQLPLIDAVVRQIAHRHRLTAEERDELGSVVRLRLIEDDYAVLRRFEGRSSLRTFLTTVITRLFLDERVRQWGKWRPSAEARRLGPTAVTLERMLVRDGCTLQEAIGQLTGRPPGESPAELFALAARLPTRTLRRPVEESVLETVAADGPSPEAVAAQGDTARARAAASAALRRALALLEPRERLILRLRFDQGCTVAHIATLLRTEQKPLYRQIDRLLARMRGALCASGVSAALVRELCDLPEVPAEGGVSVFMGTEPVPSVSLTRGAKRHVHASGASR